MPRQGQVVLPIIRFTWSSGDTIGKWYLPRTRTTNATSPTFKTSRMPSVSVYAFCLMATHIHLLLAACRPYFLLLPSHSAPMY